MRSLNVFSNKLFPGLNAMLKNIVIRIKIKYHLIFFKYFCIIFLHILASSFLL